ncbi:unannotated protein [freshwater metagenome]|uniref:Unannotated protein n=1 Tax=freshwater metagenome TaxID=449393 RepID=A0A6J7SGW5_9ZZZZ
MPQLSLRTLAIGARQLVVHDAFEIIWWLAGSYFSWLTPITIVMSSSLAGAEMMTFFAPDAMCFPASAALVKIPVDSITTSVFSAPHGRFAGSRSEKTFIVFPSTVIESSVKVTSRPRRPKIESYLRRCANVLLGVRSLIPTILIAGLVRLARKKFRPIRPKPLIPTLIMRYILAA